MVPDNLFGVTGFQRCIGKRFERADVHRNKGVA